VKKILLVVLVFAGLGLYVVRNLHPTATPTPTPAAGEGNPAVAAAVAERNARPDETREISVDPGRARPAQAIPLLDQNNPAYLTALAVMDRRFLFSLTGRQGALEHADETMLKLARSLSVAQLSQTMYEATIADVVTHGNTVTITIPSYPGEGEQLQRHVRDELLAHVTDPEIKRNTLRRFGQWGKSPQTLIVKPTAERDPYDGSIVYQIEHRMDSSVGISTVSGRHLGPYTAFAGWFPK
jgi:hypothetical protein